MKTGLGFIALGLLVAVAGAIWLPSDRTVIALILGVALMATGAASLLERWQRRSRK